MSGDLGMSKYGYLGKLPVSLGNCRSYSMDLVMSCKCPRCCRNGKKYIVPEKCLNCKSLLEFDPKTELWLCSNCDCCY